MPKKKSEYVPLPTYWLKIPFKEFESSVVDVIKVNDNKYKIVKLGKCRGKVRQITPKGFLYIRNLFKSKSRLIKMKKVNENEIEIEFVGGSKK